MDAQQQQQLRQQLELETLDEVAERLKRGHFGKTGPRRDFVVQWLESQKQATLRAEQSEILAIARNSVIYSRAAVIIGIITLFMIVGFELDWF